MHIALPFQRNFQAQETDREEVAWIEAAQVNSAAFEPLYLRYQPRIYHYLRTRLHCQEEAADLTQQVFLCALDALPRYQSRGVPFAIWLFRIARNMALKQSRKYGSCVSWDALPETFHPISEQDLEESMLYQEALAHLRDLMATLSADKRELLALRFAAGLSAPQIAVIVGKKPEAVRKQILRLLQSFREHYQHE